ncbi:hypothetical protein F5146DRAFT_1080286 [Armillaria mellea]|nr:hypothetical protein F5146DRAFT_1080286 [Armillaria mellea]
MLEVSRAEHPCPWTCGDEDDSEEEHPRQATIMGDVPLSYSLCEHANYAYMKELRTLLLPPMKNIVRRLVIECAADGCDAVRKACMMTLDDVVHKLKDEAVWFDGFDWLERRNDRLEARKTEERTKTMEDSSSSDDSSLSSKSDGSTTSPVLSTSILQTTPSPPPKEAILIPVSPILDPPRLFRPISYIPESLIHLPEQSSEVFQGIWRDACRPLYHCRCEICERAKAVEGVVQIAPEDTAQPVTAAAEIRLPSPEVNEADAEDEDVEYDSYYDTEFYSEEDDEAWSPSADRKSPEVPDLPVRKRSLDDVAGPVRSGTPPKKMKVDIEVDVPEPRLKKRNSEELEVVEDDTGRKRFKTEYVVESLPMLLENCDHSNSVSSLEEEDAR